jgi:hypothetical protein
MVQRLILETVTAADRQASIDAIGQAVTAVGGWVDDVTFFSNISVALRCVIPPSSAAVFADRLIAIGLKFDSAALTDFAAATTAAELLCTVQVTFFHSDPDLRRDVPSVPG